VAPSTLVATVAVGRALSCEQHTPWRRGTLVSFIAALLMHEVLQPKNQRARSPTVGTLLSPQAFDIRLYRHEVYVL